jgi:hypothetical protein
MFTALALALALLQSNEADYYSVDYLQLPPGAIVEVGGMGFLPDGRLVASTRRGQVWIIDNPLAKDPKDATFHLFCEGLQEGLGLDVEDGEIYVVERSELSRLRDTDHDGVCDTIDTISNQWGVSGNYHEFAYGLPRDAAGNRYVALNVGFTDPMWWHGRSLAPWRGWVVQIAKDGKLTPFASGFRSPCGIGTNSLGELFVTDNQGDWMPVCPLEQVKKGGFYGAPSSLAWTDEYLKTKTTPSLTNPVDRERTPPACWIPYKWSRSTGDMRSAPKDGSFGPFDDQMILTELTNGLVFRADLEKVRGEYQGTVMLVRQQVGSGIRGIFGKDGTFFVGMTNRGWGGLAPGHGIARVRWTGKTPFEIKHVHLLQDGLELELTEALAADAKVTAANFDVTQYHYDWWWEYGSPVRPDGKLDVTRVEVSADRKKIVMRAPIQAGECVGVVMKGLVSASGQALLHDEFHTTVNQLPEGPLCTTPIARLVPPPPARESQWEGWLRLCYGDATDLWPNHAGWKLVDAELDGAHPETLVVKDGDNALVNGVGKAADLVSGAVFGDARIHVSFMLPKGGATALMVQGNYGLALCDPGDAKGLSTASCGAILGGGSEVATGNWAGKAPALQAFRGPGLWHDIDIMFRAPRFDPTTTRKIENARFVRVMIDDVLVQEEVVLPEPSTGAWLKGTEVAKGPLILRGGLGQCAVGDIRVKPVPTPIDPKEWKPLVGDDDIEGWTATEGSTWKREDSVLVSGGKRGWLVSPKKDYTNFEVRAKCKISAGGMSAIWLRSTLEKGEARGIAALINASAPNANRTASILVTPDSDPAARSVDAPRLVSLVEVDTWFDYRLVVTSDAQGTNVVAFVNGVQVNQATIPGQRFASGAIALEQHHEGSVLEVADFAVRELPKRGD